MRSADGILVDLRGRTGTESARVANFYAKVVVLGQKECWPWRGATKPDGRGQFRITPYKSSSASRGSYELFVADVPDSMMVCHSCDNVNCVNPGHLFLGTQEDNIRDMIEKSRAKWQRKPSRRWNAPEQTEEAA